MKIEAKKLVKEFQKLVSAIFK